jgi:hypothetical protein
MSTALPRIQLPHVAPISNAEAHPRLHRLLLDIVKPQPAELVLDTVELYPECIVVGALPTYTSSISQHSLMACLLHSSLAPSRYPPNVVARVLLSILKEGLPPNLHEKWKTLVAAYGLRLQLHDGGFGIWSLFYKAHERALQSAEPTNHDSADRE